MIFGHLSAFSCTKAAHRCLFPTCRYDVIALGRCCGISEEYAVVMVAACNGAHIRVEVIRHDTGTWALRWRHHVARICQQMQSAQCQLIRRLFALIPRHFCTQWQFTLLSAQYAIYIEISCLFLHVIEWRKLVSAFGILWVVYNYVVLVTHTHTKQKAKNAVIPVSKLSNDLVQWDCIKYRRCLLSIVMHNFVFFSL